MAGSFFGVKIALAGERQKILVRMTFILRRGAATGLVFRGGAEYPGVSGRCANALAGELKTQKGMIGFDDGRRSRGSGSRTCALLANDACKPIGAEQNRTDYVLAA